MVKLKFFGKKDGPLLHPEGELAKLQLFRHFKVLKVLGRGSFATVYRVQRRSDGQSYAMKHIDIRAIDPAERTDLVNEIRLLASLDHPNLMRYYEAFVEQHQLFIVTEHVAKGDLGALLERRAEYDDWLPERQVWSYFLQLAVGLQYLHHAHVLHRDLKPQNVLIAEGGLLKIADLGISQMLDHVFTRTLMGTPSYISPEMWRRQPVSYSADIWALGCILHEMCVLKPLFHASTEREIRDKVLSGLLDSIPGRYSIDLWDVIRVMLNHDPAERPTIDEVLAMPAVQARLSLLPPEDLPYLDPSHEDHTRIMHLIRISSCFDRWDELNDLLPPSKYATGHGVVETLRLRRPSSCPHLAHLLHRPPQQQAQEGQGQQQGKVEQGGQQQGERQQHQQGRQGPGPSAPLAVPDGGNRQRQLLGRGAEEGEGVCASFAAPGPFHHSSSLPRGWETWVEQWAQELDVRRRRSITVGEMLYSRQKEAEHRADSLLLAIPGSPGGSVRSASGSMRSVNGSMRSISGGRDEGGCGDISQPGTAAALRTLGSLKRAKSGGELLPGPRGASAELPGGGISRFDASPIEFGSGSGSGSGSGGGRSRGSSARCVSAGGGQAMRGGAGAGSGGSERRGTGTSDAAAAEAVATPVHAATMVASVGGSHGQRGPYGDSPSPLLWSSNGSSAAEEGGLSPTGMLSPAQGGSSGGSGRVHHGCPVPAAALAAADGSGGCSRAGEQQGVGGRKEKKGRVRFKLRLKALLFGPEGVEGGMHQPLW